MSVRRQVITYAITGILTSALYVVIFNALQNILPTARHINSIISYIIAVIFQYFAHSKLTFQTRALVGGQAVRFAVAVTVGFFISISVIALAPIFQISDFFASVVVTLILPVVNFVLFKFWAFDNKRFSRY
jgi:putative flippase GtrA